MSLKERVNKLFSIHTNYAYPEHVLNQAESLKSLSNDLYTDSFRFIYELLQNADDASLLSTNNSQKVVIAIRGVYLIVAHNGASFTEDDLDALCAVGNGSKTQNYRKAGYKGLGFKAVFGKSDYVLIYSKGEYFRFDASYTFQWSEKWPGTQRSWEDKKQRKFIFPWQITPVWTEINEVPKIVQEFIVENSCSVANVMQITTSDEIEKGLKQLQKHPHTLLFLKNLTDIEFYSKAPKVTLTLQKNSDGTRKIQSSCNAASCWIVRQIDLVIPDEIRNALMNASNVPEKLKSLRKTELFFAAKCDEKCNIQKLTETESVLFSYMPTKITEYQLPFLVNANFITNVNREQIHTDSVWNQWLFQQIPIEVFRWIAELVHQDRWQKQAYTLIPNILKLENNLSKKYNESYEKCIKKTKFIRNNEQPPVLLSVDEAYIDSTSLSKQSFIGNDRVRLCLLEINRNTSHLALYPFIQQNNELQKLGVKTFDWSHCIQLFKLSNFYRTLSSQDDTKLIMYMYDKRSNADLDRVIRDIPFIMDHTNKLQSVRCIFIRLLPNEMWDSFPSEVPFVHTTIQTWFDSNRAIKEWLKQLGIQEKADLTYLYKKIIPTAENYIKTTDHSFKTIDILFHLFQSHQIPEEHLSQLSKLKLVTTKGTLVSAGNCYLADVYKPSVCLEQRLQQTDIFLSEKYLTASDTGIIKRWKHFFLCIGVNETITVTIDQQSNPRKSCPTRLITISFIEKTINNYDFSYFFWQYLTQSFTVKHLIQEVNALSVYYHIPVNSLGSYVNHAQWFAYNMQCIPTITCGECKRSIDTFANLPQLTQLAGNYMPVCAVIMKPDWCAFLGFKTQFSLEDYIQLLELISNVKVDQENEDRIQAVYSHLLALLSKIKVQERKCKVPRLLGENNQFMTAKELHVNMDQTTIILPKDKFHLLKLNSGNSKNPNLNKLLNLFNINQIRLQNLIFRPLNPQDSSDFKHKLFEIIDFIKMWFKWKKLGTNGFLDQLEANIGKASIFEADSLELLYNEVVIKTLTIYSINNQLFLVRPWTSQQHQIDLSTKLCEILLLKEFDKEMQFLLSAVPSEIEDKFLQLGIPLNDQVISTKGDENNSRIDDEREEQIYKALVSNTNKSYSSKIDYETIGKLALLENAQLLSKLNPIPNEPSELFLTCLNMQNAPWKGYVYHYTHIENAVSIFKEGRLKCRNNVANFKDSAAYDVIEQTRREVKDYVRFYFRPLTPTQFTNENLGGMKDTERFGNDPICPVPIFIKIPLSEIFRQTDIEWKVSLGNMARKLVVSGNTRNIIQQFDFNGVYQTTLTTRQFASSQQEFLIKSQLKLDDLKEVEILCQDSTAEECLKLMLPDDNPFKHKIYVDKSLYHNKNPKISITESHGVLKIAMRDGKKNGKIVLQYATNAYVESHQQSSKFTTISVPEKLTISLDKESTDCSVFYAYHGQIWLIMTNMKDPKLSLPHLRESLNSLLYSSNSPDPQEFLDILKEHPLLEYWYEQLSEFNCTLEEYTFNMMQLFQQQFYIQGNLLSNSFYLLLAFHALGLARAKLNNNERNFIPYTTKIIDEIRDIIPVPDLEVEKMKIFLE
ncbi:unnamed protein product [Didymodactylos carnosus]|nr:unnamed protein product [Didymodactylos carnosus]CAF3805431.1 unnamed protein product [Didymodactylos carnosus]